MATIYDSPITPVVPSGFEMYQKSPVAEALFQPRTMAPRPVSEATEFFDTDLEDESAEESNSPRLSINSLGKKSDSTLSSVDEVRTPVLNEYAGFDFRVEARPVEGPRGPHLFRASQDSSNIAFHLSMSPLTPKEPTLIASQDVAPATQGQRGLARAVSQLDPAQVCLWTPQDVATWMYEAGFEAGVVEKFEKNDISGAILIDLKFDDLKELGIQSFGQRHRLWAEIHHLRGSPVGSPIDGTPTSSFDSGYSSRHRSRVDCGSEEDTPVQPTLRRHRSRRIRRALPRSDVVVSPAESVSIVGIEQLLPKPHKCSKGERCSKFRKQQRQLALLAQEHPTGVDANGQIVIIGDPGNAPTAPSLLSPSTSEARPTSEAVPSIVASSDVLGPAQLADFTIGEDKLRALQSRDPQENVKQFLHFQQLSTAPTEEPATPPLELFPPQTSPTRASAHENLRTLPKLSIPTVSLPQRSTSLSYPRSASATTHAPPRSRTPFENFRRGTPCSAMDVPVTAIPLGPVARDTSQSVPPDMQYRRDPSPLSRSRSRTQSRHRSFGMAKLAEDAVTESRVEGTTIPPTMRSRSRGSTPHHEGWMKKRKTKFLRHEWNEHYFALQGTTLAMRENDRSMDVLEHIDVDDYAVACSSIASNKLSSALKAMKLSGKKDADSAAFAFQLVPAAEKKGAKNAALGKVHHFAVKSRDQRIDWMRELMLAKALKQKGEGYEINHNGNMI